MMEQARVLKELANRYGKQIFDKILEIREELEEKGLDEEAIVTVILDGAATSLASIFAYAAASMKDDEEQSRVASDMTVKLLDLLKDEHVRYGGRVVTVNFKGSEKKNPKGPDQEGRIK